MLLVFSAPVLGLKASAEDASLSSVRFLIVGFRRNSCGNAAGSPRTSLKHDLAYQSPGVPYITIVYNCFLKNISKFSLFSRGDLYAQNWHS